MISPPRICAVLTVEFRKFPEAVQPRWGVKEKDDWGRRRGERGGALTKRVTVKCCSVKLTEFMLVAAVLAVASTSYVALRSKILWLFKKRRSITRDNTPNFHTDLHQRQKILYTMYYTCMNVLHIMYNSTENIFFFFSGDI